MSPRFCMTGITNYHMVEEKQIRKQYTPVKIITLSQQKQVDENPNESRKV